MEQDVELLTRWRDGDQGSGRALFKLYFDPLYRFFASKIDEPEEMVQATFLAMEEAVKRLGVEPDCVLVDGNHPPRLKHRLIPVVEGDSQSLSIACASVVAKVTRDRMMEVYDGQYPQYGFKNHKGYGTPEHLDALSRLGPSPVHRRSFLPVAQARLPGL